MIRTIKADAWQHRADLEAIDWKELCERNDYQLGTVLGPSQNRSKRTISRKMVLTIILFVLAVCGAVWELMRW
jgi:hypothetical protein